MQDKDLVPIMTVKNSAGRLHYLAIPGAPELSRATAAVGMVGKLLDMAEDAFDKLSRCDRILQRDVVGNCVQVRQRGL